MAVLDFDFDDRSPYVCPAQTQVQRIAPDRFAQLGAVPAGDLRSLSDRVRRNPPVDEEPQ